MTPKKRVQKNFWNLMFTDCNLELEAILAVDNESVIINKSKHTRGNNERHLIRTRQKKVQVFGKFCLRHSNVGTNGQTDVKQQI